MHCNEVLATISACAFNLCLSKEISKFDRDLQARVLKERQVGMSSSGDPKDLGRFLPGKTSLPVACAFLLPVSSQLSSQLPSRLHLIRAAGSFDDVPGPASNPNYHTTMTNTEGKKQQ